jgi:hypothetical protein
MADRASGSVRPITLKRCSGRPRSLDGIPRDEGGTLHLVFWGRASLKPSGHAPTTARSGRLTVSPSWSLDAGRGALLGRPLRRQRRPTLHTPASVATLASTGITALPHPRRVRVMPPVNPPLSVASLRSNGEACSDGCRWRHRRRHRQGVGRLASHPGWRFAGSRPPLRLCDPAQSQPTSPRLRLTPT